MRHVLLAIASTPWAEHLVLRGSVTMAAWVGAAAREPGDLDFVVVPHTLTSNSPEATRLLDDIKAAGRAAPGAGLEPDQITETAIWTYERADGRRLAIPFSAPGPAGSGLVEPFLGMADHPHLHHAARHGDPVLQPFLQPSVEVPPVGPPAALLPGPDRSLRVTAVDHRKVRATPIDKEQHLVWLCRRHSLSVGDVSLRRVVPLDQGLQVEDAFSRTDAAVADLQGRGDGGR